jgi:imidazoleglycerol-phosphate dehydratase
MARKAKISRKTNETSIAIEINLDGTGTGNISSSIPFLDHMLNLFSKHSLIDLSVKSRGDTHIDDHHLVEDIGICLGKAFQKAIGDKAGIKRYGSAFVPMDESLCGVNLDISGRPYLVYSVKFGNKNIGGFDPTLLNEFFKAFSDHSGITLHIQIVYGSNYHHMAEAIFKAFARALGEAITPDSRIKGIPSTKGCL